MLLGTITTGQPIAYCPNLNCHYHTDDLCQLLNSDCIAVDESFVFCFCVCFCVWFCVLWVFQSWAIVVFSQHTFRRLACTAMTDTQLNTS